MATLAPSFLAHLSRRLIGELIVFPWSGICPSASSSSTISNMNISATSGPITVKFYQKHHWDVVSCPILPTFSHRLQYRSGSIDVTRPLKTRAFAGDK